MKSIVTVQEDAAEISRTYLPIQAAILVFIDVCGQVPQILPKMHEHKSLTLTFKMGRECVAFSIVEKGGQYYLSDYVHSVTLQITEDTRPTIDDTPLTLSFNR